MSLQPYQYQQTPPPSAVQFTPGKAGPSPFVRLIPAGITSTAAALAHVWHQQGAAHSPVEAALTLAGAAVCTVVGHKVASARHGAAVGAALAYGLAGSLAGAAVIGYATSTALSLLTWLGATVGAYILSMHAWNRRVDVQAERDHQRQMALDEHASRERIARTQADAQVAVARELGAAWAAERAALTQPRNPYAFDVSIAPAVQPQLGWDADAELRMLTSEPTRRELPAAKHDALDVPAWLTEPHRDER